ncbi:MAG: ABC transporter permease [Candidatus Dormibacteria bacterium]
MTTIRRLAWNPIIEKEVLSRMRSWRAPVLITLFIAILGAIAYAAFAVASVSAGQSGFNSSNAALVGTGIFATMTVTEMILVFFMSPALTAGSISGERERQTLELLLCTRVRPLGIVVGKLISSLLFVVLLLLISLPLFSLVFLIGGIEVDQVIGIAVIGLVTAAVLGSIGVLLSCIARGTISSTVGAYAVAFAFVVVPLIAGIVFHSPFRNFGSPTLPSYQLADPAIALGSVFQAPVGNPGVPLPASQSQGFSGTCYTAGSGSTVCSTPDGTVLHGGPGFFGTTRFNGPGGGFGAPINNSDPGTPVGFGEVVVNGDRVVTGLFDGWHVWQLYALFNVAGPGHAPA